VKVSFLIWEMSLPRALMIFITLVIGVVVGYLSNRGKPVSKKK
nr:LapA family protein [Deltaproteobacteria bacterium]